MAEAIPPLVQQHEHDRSTFLHSPSPPSTPIPPSDSNDDNMATDQQHVVATPVSDLLTTSAHKHSTPDSLLSSLQKHGYAVLPAFLPPHAVSTLRHAASTATHAARAGQWPFCRTLPKQFPPWPADDIPTRGIWGVQHLLHPDMPGRDAFARLYFSPRLLGVCASFMRAPQDALVLELLNLLVRPDEDFALRWHRDGVPFEGRTAQEEAAAMGLNLDKGKEEVLQHHVQYNVPLYQDASLILVPGSHLRPRTDAEARTFAADPYAPTESVPGAIALNLAPGDVVFYNSDLLHRGVYSADAERLTIHGSVGDARGGSARAQTVMQHSVGEWVQDADFDMLSADVRAQAEDMRARLVDMGKDIGAEGHKGIHDG